jgi:hypothetical protein
MEDRKTGNMFRAFLADRGLVRIAGAEATNFLQGLVTNDISRLTSGHAVYAALLTPQGKIIVDFLVTQAPAEEGGGLYLDCPRALAPDLVKRLAIYRLRAKITIEDLSNRLRVAAAWGADAEAWQPDDIVASFRDPRETNLGRRFILSAPPISGDGDRGAAALYEAHRIALGVPKGGEDFTYGEAFPHDANLDLLHGVDFDKGCYVGQEVVSRVHHRGTARKRIVRVHFRGSPPASGSEVIAGDVTIGTMGSASAGTGLAMIRTDRAEEAISAHQPLLAQGIELALAPAG